MPRTRDFFLFLIAVTFLVIAIVTSGLNQNPVISPTAQIEFAAVDDSKSFFAAVQPTEEVSYEERVAAMRAKIAADKSNNVAFVQPEPESSSEVEVDETKVFRLQLCSDYAPAAVSPLLGVPVRMSEAEGVRVWTQSQQIPSLASTSSALVTSEVTLLQVPLYPVVSVMAHCVPSDVVGVAIDGSFIRNNEAGLYGVFGEASLVGYAIDGFPIYGASDRVSDECGGVVVDGQYRYYLSTTRSEVVHCFRGVPIAP